jgi:hypothetical protein
MSLIKVSRTQINTSTYVAINLPSGQTKVRSFSLHTEDGEDYYLADNADGTNGTLMPSGLPVAFNLDQQLVFGTGTVTLCYVKGSTATYAGCVFVD